MISTKEFYEYYRECSGVSIDSRSIEDRQMFFALKGPNFDGHKYVETAFANGAKYCVIDDPAYLEMENTILVNDVEKAFQDLARYHRMNLEIPIICLTGSNGKTTTKELISSVLLEKFSVFATKGNLNNHLGVPISILSIMDNHEIAIIELGANHIGEIKFLAEMAMPQYGMITNIGKAHLEGFGGEEGVRVGKTELFKYLDKVNGVIFYNSDDKKIKQSLPSNLDAWSYSIKDIEILEGFPHLKLRYKGLSFESLLTGDYNVVNILAAIRIGEYFDVELDKITKGVEKYIPNNNRSQIIKSKSNTIIMDAYNANPSSMRVSISNLRNSSADKKVLILGHMLELGESSALEHSSLLDFVNESLWEDIYIVGKEFECVNRMNVIKYFPDVLGLTDHISKDPIKGCTILLKGSRGVALERLLPYL